jgi:hypothetical protein
MPKLPHARPPAGAEEERQIRKLAGARHAPADWIMRAQIIVFSRQGLRTSAIAAKLGCHMQTVRERIDRFNAVRRRHTRSWTTSTDPDFAPEEPRSSASTPSRRPAPR